MRKRLAAVLAACLLAAPASAPAGTKDSHEAECLAGARGGIAPFAQTDCGCFGRVLSPPLQPTLGERFHTLFIRRQLSEPRREGQPFGSVFDFLMQEYLANGGNLDAAGDAAIEAGLPMGQVSHAAAEVTRAFATCKR